jgi:hypothetical protein
MSVLGVSRPGSKGTPTTVITEQIVDAASNKDAIHQAIRLLWAPSVFQICAARATAHAAFALLKAQRRMVQACTLDSLLRGQYFLPDGTAVTIDSKRICEAIQKTKLFNAELERELPLLTDVAPTFFAVMRGDCVDAAVALRKTLGKRTCVLNMANEANPGGWLDRRLRRTRGKPVPKEWTRFLLGRSVSIGRRQRLSRPLSDWRVRRRVLEECACVSRLRGRWVPVFSEWSVVFRCVDGSGVSSSANAA